MPDSRCPDPDEEGFGVYPGQEAQLDKEFFSSPLLTCPGSGYIFHGVPETDRLRSDIVPRFHPEQIDTDYGPKHVD